MESNLKIIYIATSVIPAHKANAKQVMKMCQAFKQQGVDLDLVIPVRFGGVRLKADPFDYYGIKEKFKITKIFSFDLIPLEKVIGHLGFWLQNISFACLTAIHLMFKKYDIIYTRDRFTLLLLTYLGFSKKLVWEEHNFPKKISWFHRRLFNKIFKIVVITHGLKEEFVKADVEEAKLLVAPDGVDLAEFEVKESVEECRQKLGLPLAKKLVAYTGHLYPWKGVYVLAESSKLLPEDAEVIIVGGMADDLKVFKKFVEDNHLDKVKIVGHQPPELIPYYLKSADVLVLPNSAKEAISQKYTSPMKMFEYLAARKIMVVSSLPSIREVLTDQEAIFVQPDNADSLAQGIMRAIRGEQEIVVKDINQYTWYNRAKSILNFVKP